MTLTRRQLLGTTGAIGSAGLATTLFQWTPLSSALAQTPAGAAAPAAIDFKTFTGTVAHATHYGPFMATVTKGKIEKITPTSADARPTEMLTMGVLARTYDKTRITAPMVRKSYLDGLQGNRKPELRGKDEFVQVSWEVALGLTAKAILDTIEKHGNEAVFSRLVACRHFPPQRAAGAFFPPAGRLLDDHGRLLGRRCANHHAVCDWRHGGVFGADLVGAGA